MQIQTKELTDKALDWAVSDIEIERMRKQGEHVKNWVVEGYTTNPPPYTSDDLWAGPIIDRELIATEPRFNVRGCGVRTGLKEWAAEHPKNHGGLIRFHGYGKTRLIAAMRCYVAACRGDVVDVPDQLLESTIHAFGL